MVDGAGKSQQVPDHGHTRRLHAIESAWVDIIHIDINYVSMHGKSGMRAIDNLRSLRRWARSRHSIPVFEGRKSRGHQDRLVWELTTQALRHGLSRQRDLRKIETFVQFAGFPRSGHSLIGSIIDAHPQARVSHELDAMGLLAKGMPQLAIFALIDRMASEFTRHGRYWNGYCYLVPDAHHETAAPLRVIGDKKGDAAVRWIAKNPALMDRLQADRGPVSKWILVLRNPFDNIATMSLRHGRAYDALKTDTEDPADFPGALRDKQREGIIASEALDSQIDEYVRLCRTVNDMRHKTEADDWLDLSLEELTADPSPQIARLIKFLDLPPVPGYIDQCASMVNPRANQTRDLIEWPQAKKDRVHAICREFSFLQRYEADHVG